MSLQNTYIEIKNVKQFFPEVQAGVKPDWSVCICLTQLYAGRDKYRIYYIKNYMFRHFTIGLYKVPKHVVVLDILNYIHISTSIELC